MAPAPHAKRTALRQPESLLMLIAPGPGLAIQNGSVPKMESHRYFRFAILANLVAGSQYLAFNTRTITKTLLSGAGQKKVKKL